MPRRRFTKHTSMSELALTDILDPRPEAVQPIPGSVHIPLSELRHRVHELPRKSQLVRIPDGDYAVEGLAVLEALGRKGRILDELPESCENRFRLWSPNRFLEEVAPQLRPGAALDIACGVGRDAVYLADRGWNVTAVDHLPDALAIGQDLEMRYAAGCPSIRWVKADASSIESSRVDLITSFFFLDRTVFRTAKDWLAPGGNLLLETFTTTHAAKFGKPRPAWCLEPGELLSFASGLEVVVHEESWHEKGHTARVWARKAH